MTITCYKWQTKLVNDSMSAMSSYKSKKCLSSFSVSFFLFLILKFKSIYFIIVTSFESIIATRL